MLAMIVVAVVGALQALGDGAPADAVARSSCASTIIGAVAIERRRLQHDHDQQRHGHQRRGQPQQRHGRADRTRAPPRISGTS